MSRAKPAAVLTARPDASGAFVVEAASPGAAVAPRGRNSLARAALPATRASRRVKLTESIVGRLDAHLRAQGRDLTQACDVWDDEVRGLLLRRERSGARTWHLRVHVRATGRRSRIALGPWPRLGVEAARAAARVEAGKVAAGADPIEAKRAANRERKASLAAAKRAKAQCLGVFIEGDYKAATEHLRSQAATLAALKVDFGPGGKRKRGAGWWSKPMSEISKWDVQSWRARELKAGRKPATIRRAWQRLRAVLGAAHDAGLIGPPPIVKWKGQFQRSDGRVRYLAPEERARLLAALEAREVRRREERARMRDWQRARGLELLPEHGTYTDHLMPLVLLVLNTGLRRGEALKLTWGAIDLSRGSLHVTAESAKSGKSRDLPLNAQALAVLEAMRKQQAPAAPGAYLFALPDGTRLQSVTKSWDALVKAAQIHAFRFHDLRHDHASQLVMKGVPLNTVRVLLGHGDIAMTQRYAHLAPGHLADAVRQLDSLAVSAPAAARPPLAAVQ